MNVYIFNILIILPVILLGIFDYHHLRPDLFVALLLIYFFIYHPIITYFRLKYLKILDKFSYSEVLKAYLSFSIWKKMFFGKP